MISYIKRQQKGFSLIKVISVIAIICILIGISVFAIGFVRQNTVLMQSKMNINGAPVIKVTDFAPQLRENEKTAVLVQHADSSLEKFLLPSTTVDSYVKNLPPGDRVISKTTL